MTVAEQPQHAIAFERAPNSATAEAFRNLRTSLQFFDPERTRSLTITSSGPSEGKTTCAANIATALARSGKQVLLVDGDMRRPQLTELFALGKVQGLSHLLSGQCGDDAIQESGIDGLSVLAAGTPPPNPAELLERTQLAQALLRWRDRYDHVLVDTPAVLTVTDAVVIARRVGHAIVVARAAATLDRALQRAVERLKEAGVEVLGAVLNDVDANSDDYADYGYGRHYNQAYYRPREPGPGGHRRGPGGRSR